MSQGGGASGAPKKGLTPDDLIAAIDRHERNPSNIPKVDTFPFCGERVSEWLERVEKALARRSDVVKFQRILQYVLHNYLQEVKKVIDAVQGSFERFKEGMQRKYRLGDGLLTTADLEAMNKKDCMTIGAFVQEFNKRARKVHGISEEAQCAIFLGLLTASEVVALTRHGGGSTKLIWATIDKGVEVGCLDQVEQRQVRLQRQKRKERDATASGTPGVKRIVTDVLAQLGYATEPMVQRRVVTAVQVKGKERVVGEAVEEKLWEEEEPVPPHLTKAQRKVLHRAAWLEVGTRGRAIKATEGGVEEGSEGGMAAEEEGNGMVKAEETKARGIKARGTKARGTKARGIKAKGIREVRGRPGVHVVGSSPQSGMMGRPLTPQARLPQAARMKSQAKASANQEPPRRGPESGKRKEAVEVEDDDNEEEEDERLRREEDQRAEQRARKKGARGEVEPVVRDGRPKRKKYVARLEEGFDVERVIDRLSEGHNDLMTLKEILVSAPRLRDELKGRLSRRLVPNVHLGTILPKEAEWAELGTKMDWKCMAYGTEWTLMVELMKRRHSAYAFMDEERGRLDVDKIPMILIHIMPHEPWNMRGARYPNPDEEKKLVDYLDDKIRTHVADYLSGPYASPWFCFIKPNGTLQWVQDLQRLNAVTMRDAGGLPNADALLESCAGRPIISLIDLYSGYDQFLVYLPDKTVTATHTPRGLIHLNVAPQGWTNAVAMVQWAMIRVIQLVSPHITQPYDLAVKGPTVKESDEVSPGVVVTMKEEFRKGGLVLGAPDYDATETRPFIVEMDAGPTALGGVLIQADTEGKERPLRFESRILCTTERNYTQFKKETLTVLHCLRIFWNYIFGRRFILRVDPTALAYSLRNYVPSDPTVARWLTYIWMFNFELERIPGSKNRVDGLSRINRDNQEGEAVENTPPVDGFLDQEEDVRLHMNKWLPRVPRCVGYPIWQTPSGYERRAELVLKPFEEEDPRGSKDVQWMMELALASSHSLVEDIRTIEEGPGQVERHEDLMGGMYLLVNTLLQESFDQLDSLNPAENVDEVPKSQDDEFEEGEIKEAFRAEEYDGIYLELGLLLSCEMRLRDASDRAQRMLQRYLSYNYIFDARDNLSGFVDGRAIHTKTGSVLVSFIEEYYLRYPFVREFVMDKGSEFTCQEVQESLSRHLAAHALEHPDLEEQTPAKPCQEPCQPEKEMEAEIPKRVDLCTRERAPAGETGEEKRVRRTRRIEEIWQERQRLEAAGELSEQQQEKRRLEAAGALPGQPPSEPAKAPEIPEVWRDFWEWRGEELPSPTRAGFGMARKAEERLDRKIKFLAKTTFDRHLLLESDLARKKIKEADHGVRLEAIEVEIQEHRALVASQAAIIESLRQRSQGGADKLESSRQGEKRQSGHGLPGQPFAAETRQEPPMGRVILEPEDARAQREAEREAFDLRAPTELATLPIVAAGPVRPLAVEKGLPPSSSEPAQGSAKGSMDVLIEAVHSMQEEASLFSPEQRIEEPLEREMGIEAEAGIEGGLQRLGTPEYGPEGIEDRPGPSTQEVETREEPLDMPKSHKLSREASEAPLSPGSQREKKRSRKWCDTSCFFCTKEGHRALQCPKFLKDKAEGKVTEEGGRMYDRQGRRVERSAIGGRAQLYRQNHEEMSDEN
ncbi:hypothetical protein CBR_g68743 [Chara braunii]|uniref:CCHC-type domain-containing protein n=1 Tax=Chara braunii TaxID=69332 RepID=A0A388K9Q3_CHABU|nr:hypothetical protein CBR_g68743 [Chara braunii]|eukprot:GBG66757.1 hypothetical protein CBR_g68743 [Chara braunii]